VRDRKTLLVATPETETPTRRDDDTWDENTSSRYEKNINAGRLSI